MRIFLTRTLAGFQAADNESAEAVRKYKIGEVYRADVVKPRSYQHHKLIFALLTLTYRNLPEQYDSAWKSFDEFRYAVAVDAGHCDQLVAPSGEVFKVPKSVSYDTLDELEFTKVSAAMMTVCANLLDMNESDLAREVSRYADQNYGRAA